MTMTASLLESLPTENIKRILSFVGNVKDFHCCERVSKQFRAIIKDDDQLWTSCKQSFRTKSSRPISSPTFVEDERLKTNREKSCVARVVFRIKWYQCKTDNSSFLAAFGDDDQVMTRLVHRILWEDDYDPHHEVHLRPDTSHCLSEILQTFLMTYFQKANDICCECCPENEYPKLKVKHLELVDRLVGTTDTNGHGEFFSPLTEFLSFLNDIISPRIRDRVIRTTAYRAGVVMMEDAVFEKSWAALIKFLEGVLKLVLTRVEHEHFPPPTASRWKRRRLVGRDTPREVFPLVRFLEVCDCGDLRYQLTPVPRQFEEAAAKIRPSFPFGKVYLANYDNSKCERCGLKSHGDSKCEYIDQDDSSTSSVEDEDGDDDHCCDISSTSSFEDEASWCEDDEEE